MSNEDMNPRRPLEREEKKRIGFFEPLRFGRLPGFWLYMLGAILLTGAVAAAGAWLLVRMGVQ
ncbi:MAG: hypothetical protein K2P86_13520 [Xanthobacteraceae bacterium]|nr:hypothetical protein [Xanthobacteraceae bacterium]